MTTNRSKAIIAYLKPRFDFVLSIILGCLPKSSSKLACNVSRVCEVAEKGAEYFLLTADKLSEKRHYFT